MDHRGRKSTLLKRADERMLPLQQSLLSERLSSPRLLSVVGASWASESAEASAPPSPISKLRILVRKLHY